MNTRRHSFACTLIGWSAALLPAHRAPWAAAMKAEVDAIADGDAALSFAIGCLWGSIKETVMTMNFAARSLRFVAIAGMLTLAIVSALLAERMVDTDASSALVFGLTSVLFGAAAAWSYVRGPTALVQTARFVIPLYIIAYIFVSARTGVVGGSANSALFEALAIEGMVIWTALLAGGVFMLRVGTPSTPNRT